MLLPYDTISNVAKIEKLKDDISSVTKLILEKAVELKAIEKISSDEVTNYEVLKNIFYVRIIKLEDAYLKITKEKDKYFLQIFDENIFQEKVQIPKPEGLEIKLNKKMSFWGRF